MTNDKDAIEELLSRGVENVYPAREAVAARLAKERVTLYLGIDPTGPTLHLGHAIPLMKLAELQKLGHKIILLIGDFTGMIGDPTDKSAARKRLTRDEVLANAALYKQQASKFISFEGENAAELKYNADWLGKMSFADVVELAAHFTVQQMMERDMFEKRMEEGKPIHLHEFFYPLMQGYDSVAMDVDGEIGGNDQTFNMLAGRTLMKEMKGKDKFVMTMKLLTDPTGKKMGKSEGNMITLQDSPDDMFGKVMSWSDGMIVSGFELLTDLPKEELVAISKGLIRDEVNPRDAKAKLASLVVDRFCAPGEGAAALERFDKRFKEGEKPEEIQDFSLPAGTKLADALVATELVASKSDARRQVEQGGVKVNDMVATDFQMELSNGDIIQKGKRFFARIVCP